MPITQTEAGLTSDQWTSLTNLVKNTTFDVLLYSWTPNFATSVTGVGSLHDFDAASYQGEIYRVSNRGADTLPAPVAGYTLATGALYGVPPSLVSDDKLYVFAPTTSGISQNSYDGSSWSGWSTVVTSSEVLFIAATDKNTVHFIDFDATNLRYHFRVALYSGSWSVVDSDIYWSFPIQSFGAKRLNGVDSLLFSSDLPGVISEETVDTTLVKYLMPAGGICSIQYKYGSWSDYFLVDYVDQWSSFRFRSQVCLSLIGDTLWMTCYSSEGTQTTPIVGNRIYSSKDGKHWSRGELFPLTDPNGLLVIQQDTTLYTLTRDAVWTAPSTLWFGNPDSSQVMNILPQHVTQLYLSRQDLQQLSLTIENKDNWLAGTLAASPQTLAVILRTGFYSGGRLTVQQGIFEVDVQQPMNQPPVLTFQLTARDRLAWMTGKSQAETFRYWQPQQVGIDEYQDTTGTGYGGMTHSAPSEGSFMAYDGALQLVSDNSEGVVLSTFLNDCWNGAVENWCELSTLNNHEYVGVIFRAQDYQNGFFYYYDQHSDTLRLDERQSGTVINHWTSSTKGWSGSLVGFFLRAEFRYARVRLYSSTDPSGGGVEWVGEVSLLLPGQSYIGGMLHPDGTMTGAQVLSTQSGYVGEVGWGYSPEDVFSDAPEPAFTTLPPDFEVLLPRAPVAAIKFWCLGAPSNYGDSRDTSQVGKGDVTSDLWVSAEGGTETGNLPQMGATNPWNLREKWIASKTNLSRADIWVASPDWEVMETPASLFADGTAYFYGVYLSPAFKGLVFVTSTDARIARSEDGGLTWTFTVIAAGSFGGQVAELYMGGFDGSIWALLGGILYHSPDYGGTWGLATDVTDNIQTAAVPYRLDDGSPNSPATTAYRVRSVDSGDHLHYLRLLERTDDGGVTWALRSTLDYYLSVGTTTSFLSNLYVHPRSSLYLAYVSDHYVYRSQDGGRTWTQLDTEVSPLIHVEGWPFSTDFFVVYSRNADTTTSGHALYTVDTTAWTDLASFGAGTTAPIKLWGCEADLSEVLL